MASNFYNLTGVMIGVDIHNYVMFPAVPTYNAHVVGAPFWWINATPHKIGATVTMNGSPCLRGGFSNALVNHCPIPLPPPSPLEIGVLAWVIVTSGTKAQLTAHKVTHKGDALAVCVKSMLGLNVNCGDPFDMPTGAVINVNSVETQPTAGDYAGAIAGYIVDAALGWALGKAGERLGGPLRQAILKWIIRVVPEALKPATDLLDPAGKTQEFVQKLVDGEEGAPVPFLPPFLPPLTV